MTKTQESRLTATALTLPGFSAGASSVLFEDFTGWSIKSSSSIAFVSSRGFLSELGYNSDILMNEDLLSYFTKISRKSSAGMTLLLSFDNTT